MDNIIKLFDLFNTNEYNGDNGQALKDIDAAYIKDMLASEQAFSDEQTDYIDRLQNHINILATHLDNPETLKAEVLNLIELNLNITA